MYNFQEPTNPVEGKCSKAILVYKRAGDGREFFKGSTVQERIAYSHAPPVLYRLIQPL
jgi:hypothetical protein